MPAVGSVNVKVGVSIGGLVTGLGVGARAVSGFGAKVTSVGGKGLAGLATGAGKAASGLRGMTSGIASVATKLGPLGVAITGVAGAAGIGLLVNNSLQALDANAKLAKSLGMSQEKLTGYQHAAELSGVSSEALRGALGKLTRKGIDLEVLADKMKSIQNPTDRAKLAFDVLGKSGQELLPLLSEGGDKIREMVADGAQLQGVFSPEDIAGVEAANDAVTRTQAAFQGIANSVAVVAAPALKIFADNITSVGTMARDTFTSLTPVITQVASTVTAYVGGVGQVWGQVFHFIGETAGVTFGSVKDTILDALIAAEFGFSNIGPIASLAWDQIKLGAVQTFGVIGHFFTTALPGYFTWFGSNWRDVFFTAFDLASTVFINLGKNIRSLFDGIWTWIRSGFKGAFTLPNWEKDLTRGAANAIKSMPDIPARVASDLEKQLTNSVATAADKLGSDFGDFRAARMKELSSPAAMAGTVTSAFDVPSFGESGDLIVKKLDELKGPQAVQRGSSEAFSAVFKAMRGNPGDEMKRTAEAQLRQATNAAKGIDKLVKAPKVELVAGDA